MMMGDRCWLVVAVLLSLTTLCASQNTCMKACDIGLTTCSFLDYPILVNNNITAIPLAVEAQAQKIITQASPAAVGAQCSDLIKILICNLYFKSCNASIPVALPPCQTLCSYYTAVCGPLYAFLPAELLLYLDCSNSSGIAPYAPKEVFPPACSMALNTTSPCPHKDTKLLYAGVCRPYNMNLSSAAVCSSFIDKQIYVDVEWPVFQKLLDYLFIQGNYLLRFQKAYPVMPLDCYKRMSALICGTYFPSCVTIDVPEFNTTAVVPQKPCQTFCDTAIDHCWDFFAAVNLTYLLTNCSVAYPDTTPYTVNVGNALHVPSTCRSDIFPRDPITTFVAPVLDACPTAFGLKSDYTEEESRCGLSCPDSSYTKEEWHRLVRVTQAGSSLSLIFMTFMIVSYLVQFEKRKFPSAIHFWEFVATAGFAISFLINGKEPEKNVWCKDPGTSATQSNNAACGAQGFLFIFFGLSLAAWCLAIAFVIFYGVVQNRKVRNLAKYTKFFHLFCWGGPLAFAIGALASKSIGYGPPLAWCFIHFEGFGYGGDGVSRDYPTFYIPMLLMFVIILILFISTVSKIIYVRKMKVNNSKGLSSRTLQAQIRVLIFILVVFVICVSIFEWRFEIEGAKAKEKVGLAWAYCKMQLALAIPVSASDCPGETNPARIEYSRTVGESFVLSGIGLLIFVGFGADIGIYKHWVKIFKLAYRRSWGQIKDLVLHDKDPFASGSNRTKSTSGNSNPSKDSPSVSKDSSGGNTNSKNSAQRDTVGDESSLYNEDAELSASSIELTEQGGKKAEIYQI